MYYKLISQVLTASHSFRYVGEIWNLANIDIQRPDAIQAITPLNRKIAGNSHLVHPSLGVLQVHSIPQTYGFLANYLLTHAEFYLPSFLYQEVETFLKQGFRADSSISPVFFLPLAGKNRGRSKGNKKVKLNWVEPKSLLNQLD